MYVYHVYNSPIAKHNKIQQADISMAVIYPPYLNLSQLTLTHFYVHFIYSYMKFPPPDKLTIQPDLNSTDVGIIQLGSVL